MLQNIEGDEKAKVTKIVVAALILGTSVALAGPIIGWLSGVDISNPSVCTSGQTITSGSSGCLPPQLANLMRNGMTIMILVGAFIAAVGMIIGFVKL